MKNERAARTTLTLTFDLVTVVCAQRALSYKMNALHAERAFCTKCTLHAQSVHYVESARFARRACTFYESERSTRAAVTPAVAGSTRSRSADILGADPSGWGAEREDWARADGVGGEAERGIAPNANAASEHLPLEAVARLQDASTSRLE